jgi:hypothetical protein
MEACKFKLAAQVETILDRSSPLQEGSAHVHIGAAPGPFAFFFIALVDFNKTF